MNQKVILMKKKLLTLTATQKQLFIKSTAERVTEIEKTRSFDRICCVLDMDMFFAAVEIRDQPHLKELPVAVGGDKLLYFVLQSHDSLANISQYSTKSNTLRHHF